MYMHVYSNIHVHIHVHVHVHIHVHVHVHVYVLYILGDCLTSRPKGHLRPRELWFLIYSCTICVKKVHVYTRKNVSSFTVSGTYF